MTTNDEPIPNELIIKLTPPDPDQAEQFYESPQGGYPNHFAMSWGIVEYGERLPIRVTIMSTEALVALENLSHEEPQPVPGTPPSFGKWRVDPESPEHLAVDPPEYLAASLVGEHMEDWLAEMVRLAAEDDLGDTP